MAVSTCTLLLIDARLAAQPNDELQRSVATMLAPFDTTNLGRAGRLFIIDRLDRESTRWIPEVLEYIDQRQGTGWIAPPVRTLLMMLTGQVEELELAVLAGNPSGIMYHAESSAIQSPDPAPAVRQYARRSQRQIIRFLTQEVDQERHAEFLLLLFHSLTIRGVRGVDELNERVDEFAAGDTTDPRSSLALRYLRREVTSEPFGIGLVAGYDAGSFVATGEREGIGVHGPRFGFIVWGGAALLEMTALARSIERTGSNETSVEGGVRAGYDLVESNLHLGPIAGLHYWSISSDGERVGELLTPLFGFDVGTRLLFDDPPHLHLSIGAEWHLPSIVAAPMTYERSFWSLRFSLALVNRSYRIE